MALVKGGEKALTVAGNSDKNLGGLKRDKRKVLEEEIFVSDLEKIIQRDFFPDLKKLKAQKEYMEAMERNDLVKMRELAIKYASTIQSRPSMSMITPGPEREQTPATFETPVSGQFETGTPHTPFEGYKAEDGQSTKEESTESHDNAQSDTSLSLDKYLAKFTSEDNISFGEIMAKSREKHQQKHAWLYEAEKKHQAEQEEMLTLKNSEELAIESRCNSLNTWKYQAKNALMYVPEGVDASIMEQIEKKPKEQEISHTHTRLTSNPFSSTNCDGSMAQAAGANATRNQGKIGADGKEITTSNTPQVNGYGFVATPSPAPGVNDSPMMTWGEIEGTPFRLGGDTPVSTVRGPQFRIPDVPRKERLGHSLVDKVTKKNRAKKEEALKRVAESLVSPSPKRFGSVNSLERIRTLSSAAQKLVQRTVGSADKALRASYTPSPQRSISNKTPSLRSTPGRTPGLTPSKSPALKLIQQSGANTGASSSRSQSEPASLTDNLLDLPKRNAPAVRQKATDFF